MSNLLLLLVSSILVNSLAVSAPNGTAPSTPHALYQISQRLGTATALLAVVSTLLAWFLKEWVQANDTFGALDLLLLTFAMMVCAIVTDRYLRSRSETYAQAPTVTTILLASNSISIGVVLLRTAYVSSFADALLGGIAAGIAFALLLLAFVSLRERVDQADVPVIFRAIPVQLITAGCVSLALMGLIGIARA